MGGSIEMEIFHLNLAKIFFKDIKSRYFFIITGLLLKYVLLFGNFWHYWTVEFHKRNFTLTTKNIGTYSPTLMKKSKQAYFVKDKECMGMSLQGFKDLHCYGRMRTIGLVVRVLKWRYICL